MKPKNLNADAKLTNLEHMKNFFGLSQIIRIMAKIRCFNKGIAVTNCAFSSLFLLMSLLPFGCRPIDDLGGTSPAWPQTDDLKAGDSKFCGNVKPEKPFDPTPPFKFDTRIINGKLQGSGLNGWIHGAASSYRTYTFTYRLEDENDSMAFFKAEQFSLIPSSPEVAAIFATLNRHDEVRLFGKILENGSPITHISVTKIDMIQRYPNPPKNNYDFDFSKLSGKDKFKILGQVHAVANSAEYGTGVVVEWEDILIPVAVPRNLTYAASSLYRGDIIKIALRVVNTGRKTQHFEIDNSVEKPLEVVDPMLNCHNQDREVIGYLAKFDRSPAITTDIYAIRVVDKNGIGRNFTLFPASKEPEAFMQVFRAISAKAKLAWNAEFSPGVVVRNFYKKESIRVKARGRLNVVSSEQANAQIYIESADDVEFY